MPVIVLVATALPTTTITALRTDYIGKIVALNMKNRSLFVPVGVLTTVFPVKPVVQTAPRIVGPESVGLCPMVARSVALLVGPVLKASAIH